MDDHRLRRRRADDASRSTRARIDARRAHSLPPRLTRFDGVQFLQDRFGVVLVQADLDHGPGRPQPDGGRLLVAEQVGERVHGRDGEGRDPADAALKVAWRADSNCGLERRHPRSASGAASTPQCRQRAAAFHDRRRGQERQNGLLAHGRGFGAVAAAGFPVICGYLPVVVSSPTCAARECLAQPAG